MRFVNAINYRFISRLIGMLCLLQLPGLLVSLAFSLYYNDGDERSFIVTLVVMSLMGLLLVMLGRRANEFPAGRREGMLSVTLSWFVVASIGMLPYYLGGHAPTLSDAFFETISGFTTTGGTIFKDVEALPKSILFWRSITQWEGGIGIVVFAVALLPMMGGQASIVYNSETTGVTHERFLPRVGMMAKWVSIIYIVLTLLCVTLLALGPMSLFDSVCHAATCISTGGFSTKNLSLGAFNSLYINIVCAIFMIMGATNLTLIYYSLKKQHSKLFRDTEFRWFIAFISLLTVMTALILYMRGIEERPLYALHDGFVQVVSLITTTGYAITDYNMWLPFFGFIALAAMFVAGCAGSTSGGFKTIRLVILFKNLDNEFAKRTHPNAVLPVRIGGHAVPGKVVLQVLAFFFAYLALSIVAAFFVSLDGFAVGDSISAAVACISNSGPGLGAFGPMNNYSELSAFNKVFLSIIMVMGRLEIFTVLTIFHHSFWKN